MVIKKQKNSLQENLIRWPEVAKRVGLCRSHVHALIAKGEFPAQIKLSNRASAWIESQIDDWVSNRIKASQASKTSNSEVTHEEG